MGSPLAVRTGVATAREVAGWSRAALDMSLESGAELWVHEVTTPALVLGAFERVSLAEPGRLAGGAALAVLRRGSGGPSVLVAPGTVHVALALAHAGALTECPPGKLVNRYVRPLLRALTGLGATARYFGRDWVSVESRPAAWIGFGHDAASGRSLVEAFVAVDAPFAPGPRASFLGKEPGTLAAITHREIPPARVVAAVTEAYARAYAREPIRAPPLHPGPVDVDVPDDPPWRATAEEVIGLVGAGRDREGTLRLGGALLASRDAVHEAERRAATIGPDADELGHMVSAIFRAPGVTLDGVRKLDTLRDVLLRAMVSTAA